MQRTLTIGQLATRAGVAASAIRFYERSGVLPPAERVGGQRRYGPEAVRRREVLAVAKRAGFTLDEARVLLESGEPPRDLAARKLPEVEAHIARAQEMRTWLLHASQCECETLDVCALFAARSPSPPGAPA